MAASKKVKIRTKENTNGAALASALDRLTHVRIAVVGDVMLDRYAYGDVERISPEGPIPVFRRRRTVAMLGGAGNVVRNIGALGAKATLIGLIGASTSNLSAEQKSPHPNCIPWSPPLPGRQLGL